MSAVPPPVRHRRGGPGSRAAGRSGVGTRRPGRPRRPPPVRPPAADAPPREQRLAGRRPRRRRVLRRGHAGGTARGAIGQPRCSMPARRRRSATGPATTTAVRLHGLRCADRAAGGRPRRGGVAASTNTVGSRPMSDATRRLRACASRSSPARVMLGARRMAEADEWIALAERPRAARHHHDGHRADAARAGTSGCSAVSGVAVDIIDWRAHDGWPITASAPTTSRSTRLITAGWCRLSTGDLADANRSPNGRRPMPRRLANAWNQLQAGLPRRAPGRRHRRSGPLPSDVVDELRAVVAVRHVPAVRRTAARRGGRGPRRRAAAPSTPTVDRRPAAGAARPAPAGPLPAPRRTPSSSDAPRRAGGVAGRSSAPGRARAAHPPPRHRRRRTSSSSWSPSAASGRLGAAVPRARSARRTAAAGDPARRGCIPGWPAPSRSWRPTSPVSARRAWCAPDESRAVVGRAAADPPVLRRDGRAPVPVGQHGEVEPQGGVPQARRHDHGPRRSRPAGGPG